MRACACVCVCVEVITHTVIRHVYVSSDGETVCSRLVIASLSTFLRNRECYYNNKEIIIMFRYKCVHSIAFVCMCVCCTDVPNVPLLQNGCCNMAAIHIPHFTPYSIQN